MVNVGKEMERQKFTVPLLIGGATTSKIHTAVKIERNYSSPVIHVKDASRSVAVAGSLMNKEIRSGFETQVREEYEELRKTYASSSSQVEYVSLVDARKNSFKIQWEKSRIVKPVFLGVKVFDDYEMKDIREYISWVFFFVVWQLRGKFPDILKDPAMGVEAMKLFEDANAMLDRIVEDKWLQAKAVVGFWPANSVGDDIEVYSDEKRSSVITRFINLRNQTKKSDKSPNYCLSDFIAPKDSGIIDYIGAFAVTAGIGIEKKIEEFLKDHDDYNSIMLKSLADRLAEAFTELLHLRIRKEFWAYAPEENLSLDDLLLEKYTGIRPAHGYPACPDHSEKSQLFKLLDAERSTGIELTESFSMYPAASVSGLIFANQESKYFFVGKIAKDQAEDYAKRKGVDISVVESWVASNLNY
jgi:5-methyltetrahydrofolate--homocysteine methyltransferase